MAIKDRITGLFRFGRKKPDDEAPALAATAEPASAEERQELIKSVGDGFSNVGRVLESLDRHLDTGTRSLEGMIQTQNRLPALLEEQRHLVEKTGQLADTQRQTLELLRCHLEERDRTTGQIADRLEDLGHGLRELRDQDRSRMDLLLQFQRSGRRMALLLGLVAIAVIMLLMGLLIVLSLRPDLLGLGRSTAGAPQPDEPAARGAPAAPDDAQRQAALRRAQDSSDALIRSMAATGHP